MRTLIVGGVAGGATTAARLRRNDESAEIIIFERGNHISYANCGLPYYIGGVITDREQLFVQTPELFKANHNIDVCLRTDVVSIDPAAKTIHVRNLDTNEERDEKYDKLVLSPGAEPVKPPIPGINDEAIFTLRSVPETDAIKEFVDTHQPKRAVVVGAGFIGLEMAENLHERGVFVTIVEMAQQVMNVVDFEMAAMVHQHLKTKHVEFYLRDGVARFDRTDNGLNVQLSSGRSINADMVILSIGVRPESSLARDAGLEIGETRGIKVSPTLQTSNPDIYAVGDVIEFPNPITGQPTITYLAGPANKQGRIVANNIVDGNTHTYGGAIQTAVAKVFDVTVASTGTPEKVLEKLGMPYKAIITHSSAHAGYYPGATAMSIKTIFHPETGRLYSGQIVGHDGVDKRIDLMASVVRSGGTIYDLTELEHGYAPPYSSAKDPVNIAGFVAENVISGRTRHIQWHQVRGCDLNELALIDVRTPEEFMIGTIEGAVNIPLHEFRARVDEIPRDKTVIVFCGVGQRAYHAERILRGAGFPDVLNLTGGLKTYETATEHQSNEDIYSADFIGKDGVIYQAHPDAAAAETNARPQVRPDAIELDARGLQCPGPIMKLKTAIDELSPGQQLVETASDPGFGRDVESWCRMTGNTLVDLRNEGAFVKAVIEKGLPKPAGSSRALRDTRNGTTIVVFSDALDKALAATVIANGAASSGKEVTLFFTFWGLSLIKKERKPRVKKDIMARMFGAMLPGSAKKLQLSKMNFGGVGVSMMKTRMKNSNVDDLTTMLEHALKSGVRLIACQMSMDVMGVTAEELIDGVEISGVAAYLEAAEESNPNLFI